MILKKDYQDCLEYIRNYWPKITFYLPEEKGLRIGLPYKFVSPSNDLFEQDQFYWDTYFTIVGLIAYGKKALAKGMVDNLIHLFNRFGIIPCRNRIHNLGFSQPPFLTSMILEIYKVYKDKSWLSQATQTAELELKNYWQNEQHKAFNDLSRYCDSFWTNPTAEHESGWDMTSRFNERCLDYLPIDLNCCLYKYEKDLSEIYKILGDKAKEKEYLKKSEKRKHTINKLMWSESKGFFFDFDYKKKEQSDFYSLAGFYPLWAGLATENQAKKVLKVLRKFEYKGGLANTQKKGLSKLFKQWDWPNGWPNQQFIVIEGLLNYGYRKRAEKLAKKWLDLNKKVFIKTGKFWEKYNVVNNDVGKDERYPIQTGFGWTNAIFVKLIEVFSQPK